MTEIENAPPKSCARWFEAIMVVVLISTIALGALTYMVADSKESHLRSRDISLQAAAAISIENRAVVDAYRKCWMDLNPSSAPRCALKSVALGRSQGRTEIGVSELIGSMGIFETGCSNTATPSLYAVMNNRELKSLMDTWCLTHAPKNTKSPERENDKI